MEEEVAIWNPGQNCRELGRTQNQEALGSQAVNPNSYLLPQKPLEPW